MVSAQSAPETGAPPAEKMSARQSQWLQASVEERIRLAERLGEEGAEAFAAKHGYEPLLQRGDRSLPQGLDQVYRTQDGDVVVIEAKGGTSAVGRAYGCQQGTPEWAVQAAKRVAQSSKASLAEKQAAKLVLEAAQQGKLTVQVVRTRHVLGEPVLGEPVVAVVESTLKAGQAEGKIAAAMLEEMAVAAKAVRAAGQAAKTAEAASTVTAGAKMLSKVGKAAGVAAIVVDGAVRVNSAIEVEKKFESGEISDKEREMAHAKYAAGMVGGWGGAIAGAKLGSAGGAALGSVIAPGPGTAVGAVLGGAAGGVAGYLGGEAAAEAAATWVVDSVHGTGRTVAETATDAWRWSTTPVRGAWSWFAGN
jgi:hypothetical protein